MTKAKIIDIVDPPEKLIKVATKSVLISRLPKGEKADEFKTAILRLYDVNNPHKKDVFPKLTYTFPNTEKVRIRRLNVSYYLEGNDIVINDLEELYITHDKEKLVIKGYQIEVEHRDPEDKDA